MTSTLPTRSTSFFNPLTLPLPLQPLRQRRKNAGSTTTAANHARLVALGAGAGARTDARAGATGAEADAGAGAAATSSSAHLCSPLRGTVIALHVCAGERVHKGQPLAVIEAMKMENVIAAPHDGIIEEVYTHVAEAVTCDTPLIQINS